MTDERRAASSLPPPPPLAAFERPALLLDFDGTLVEIAEQPHLIAVPERLPGMLAALSARMEGRMAIVSGRSVADLGGHLDLNGIAAAGSHGGEVRRAGAEAASPPPPMIAAALEAVRTLAARHERLSLEEKTHGMAVHFRAAPHLGPQIEAAMADIAERHGLAVKRGKMVAELLPRGFNKGAAVTSLMQTPPFEGSQPIFIGDDVTDEDGFAAAAALGGIGILVGPARETAARYCLTEIAAVYEWLTA